MPIWATGPQGAATRQPWKLAPIPPGLDQGPIDVATLAMLRACEARPGDVDRVLAPSLGLGAHAGLPPVGRHRLQASEGLSGERTRWLLREAASLARQVGPPASLTAALVLVDQLGVVSSPSLVDAWCDRGLIGEGLHPLAVEKIARLLYGLDTGFRVATGEKGRWRTQLVVARRLDASALPAVGAIRPALRAARMLTVTSAAKLAPGLTVDDVERLCDACWTLSPDRDVVVDWQPKGLDWGIGRTLIAAGPLRADAVHGALARWVRDAPRLSYDWTARKLDRYLVVSPLYMGRPGGTHALASDWCDLIGSDRDILAALDTVGSPAPRSALVEVLVGMGYSENAAKHLIRFSPVVTPIARGLYGRIGS